MISDVTLRLWEVFVHSQSNFGHANRASMSVDIEKYIQDSCASARETAARVKQEIFPFTPQIILDVGCSTGFKCYALAEVFPEAQVIGLDPELQALQITNTLDSYFEITQRPIFIHSTGENIPLPDESIDLITCHTVLEHVASVQKTIGEMGRISRSKARAHIEGPNYIWPYEPHLHIWCVPLLGKRITSLFAYIQGKKDNIGFLEHLNFETKHQIQKMFMKQDFDARDTMVEKLRRIADGELLSKSSSLLGSLLYALNSLQLATPLISLLSKIGMTPSLSFVFTKEKQTT